MYLEQTLKAWGRSDFQQIFKQELSRQDLSTLPLQQGLIKSSYALYDDVSFSVYSQIEKKDCISIKLNVFYFGVIAGCNCSDDPSPIDKNMEQCDLQLDISRTDAKTRVSIIS